MENQRIIDEINHDIERGVYLRFGKLKFILERITYKLAKDIYVSNYGLNNDDLDVLMINDYISLNEMLSYKNK